MGPDSLIELGFKRKTLKEGKTPETAAHKITKDYMGEILEKTIQSYMGRKPGITPWRYFRKTVT
ncbi:hypothetical protein SAMN05428981_11522 [Bacillus sp. OV194]|nr:hypothetical protein SAMN05428981_11522 [Bacillus sp. OV194]